MAPDVRLSRKLSSKLFEAVRADSAGGVRRVLGEGAHPRSRADDDSTPLILAARIGARRCFDILFPLSDPNAVDREGRGVLHWAAATGDASIVQAVLTLCRPEHLPAQGSSAFFAAVSGDHLECARLIRAALPGVEFARRPPTPQGETPLMAAAHAGSLACMPMLIRPRQAKELDSDGRNALFHAASEGHRACLDLLLSHSKKQTADKRGITPILAAAAGEHFDCVARLIPHADVNARGGVHKSNPLMLACSRGHREGVELLLPITNLSLRNARGQSAADLARERGREAMAARVEAFALAQAETAAMASLLAPSGEEAPPPSRKRPAL